jgi:hypothetical protein
MFLVSNMSTRDTIVRGLCSNLASWISLLTHGALGDKHVHFECELLHDYYLIKAKVDANPDWGFTMEQLCNSNWMGYTHDLNWELPGDYSTDMSVGEGGWRYHQISSKGYDVHSIMHYGSENAFAAVGNCAGRMESTREMA